MSKKQQELNTENIARMIYNFPAHVGDFDANLPEIKCGRYDYHGQSCFRDGWNCAIDAVKKTLKEMQNRHIKLNKLCVDKDEQEQYIILISNNKEI